MNSDKETPDKAKAAEPDSSGEAVKKRNLAPLVVFLVAVLVALGLAWFLTTITSHKQEASQPFTAVTEITEKTYDPEVAGSNPAPATVPESLGAFASRDFAISTVSSGMSSERGTSRIAAVFASSVAVQGTLPEILRDTVAAVRLRTSAI